MIDISDGLARDLGNICRASGLGAAIEADLIPIHQDAILHSPTAPVQAALCDGEDYELLFTLPPSQARKLLHDKPFETPVTRIGVVRAEPALMLCHSDGSAKELQLSGWEHET